MRHCALHVDCLFSPAVRRFATLLSCTLGITYAVCAERTAATEPWIDFSMPAGVRAWVSVSDAAAAFQWQREHGAADFGDLEATFALRPNELAGLHRSVARCEWARDDAVVEFLVVEGKSPDDAKQISKQVFAGSGAKAIGNRVLATARPADLDALAGIWNAAAARRNEEHQLLRDAATEAARFTDDVSLTTAWYAAPAEFWREQKADADYVERHGLDAISAVGGAAAFSAQRLEVAVTQILARAPMKSSLAMMQLKPVTSLAMPSWLDSAQRGGALLSADMPVAFSHLAAFFDDAFAEGIEGTYREVLADIRDSEGLDLDLERALYARFGDQAFLGNSVSGRLNDGRRLAAILLQDDGVAAAADAVRRMMEDDPEVKREMIEGQTYPLWLYPTDADSWGGVIVAGERLIICHDEALLRKTLAAEQAARSPTKDATVYGAPVALPIRTAGFAGVFLADRHLQESRPSKLLAPLFSGFSAPQEKNGDRQRSTVLDLEFLAGSYAGWCFFDEHGWRLVACEAAQFESIATEKTSR